MTPDDRDHEHGGSTLAVLTAFLANVGIAISKLVAFFFTGSSSMLSEAIHSVADTGNQGLLMVGRVRARRPPDERRPFGYGPMRYFYAFIVAFVMFSLGGVFSIVEGVDKLRHPAKLESVGWAIAVLVVAIVMESLSFRTGVVESRRVRGGESLWEFVRHTKNPDFPVVILEDLAALVGLTLALVGIVVAHVTTDARWDGAGSLGIGVLLVVVAVVLVIEMGSLLVGEAARPRVVAAIHQAIESFPLVQRCIHLRTEHIGPDEIVVAAKVEFDHGLTIEELARAIDELEVDVRAVVPRATLIFIEPDVYREPATG